MFTFKNAFINITLEHISSFFDISVEKARLIVFKMIYNKEIEAMVEGGEKPYIVF